MSFRGIIVPMQKDKKRWRNPYKTNLIIPVNVCLFFFVTGHNTLPLGKLTLCRTMGSRSKSCTYPYTLSQMVSYLSHLSHSVEQALGWATVQRVLPCYEYKRTVSKNAKGLGWCHWDAEEKPFFESSYKRQFSPIHFHKLVTLEAELPGGQSSSPKNLQTDCSPWYAQARLLMHARSCPRLRLWTVVGLWDITPWLRSLALHSIRHAGGKNINFNIWWRVLWTEHWLCQPGLISQEMVNYYVNAYCSDLPGLKFPGFMYKKISAKIFFF